MLFREVYDLGFLFTFLNHLTIGLNWTCRWALRNLRESQPLGVGEGGVTGSPFLLLIFHDHKKDYNKLGAS